jgi:hypothetical protein
MKKVLLLSLPYKPHYMRNARCDFVSWCGCQFYPIQLGHLGAFLESKNYAVKIIDAPAYGLNDIQVGALIKSFMPDYAIIYAGNDSFESDMQYYQMMNEIICPTKLAGVFYALNADKYHIAGIEGCLEDGVLDWIEGKADASKPIVGEDLTSTQLDAIPFVSKFYLRHLDPAYYVTPSEPWPFVDIMTARGCSYGACAFCLWPNTYTKKYTPMSLLRVMEEVKFIEKYTPYRSIMIEDDTFPEDRAWDFSCKKLLWNLKIPWSCLARAEISYHALTKMKEAGCLNVHVGYESGNDDTLKRIHKGITVAQAEEFTENAKRAGLHIHGDFMIGIDDCETKILKTIDWACKLRPDTAQFQTFIPFFGERYWLPDYLNRMSQYAYRKFYRNPKSWPAVLKQFGKPRILKESLKSVLWRKKCSQS